MNTIANAGARLDRLEFGPFHRRLLLMIGAGMFFDGFDVYMAGGVLGALVKDGVSTLAWNAYFISATFAGMMIGSMVAGFVGDRFGRRASYQANLFIFGLASLAGAFAPDMRWLTGLRFVMGIGLGSEIVVGYAMLAEFVPPAVRGRWLAILCVSGNFGLLASTVLAWLLIPSLGWRYMFAFAGFGALILWYMRKSMPESPRWLESMGRGDEADRILREIEEVSVVRAGAPVAMETVQAGSPAKVSVLLRQPVLGRLMLGIVIYVAMGTVLYGFVSWVPTFLVKSGLSVATSLGYSIVMSLGGPVGGLLAWLFTDRLGRRKTLLLSSALIIAFGAWYSVAAASGVATVLAAGFGLFSSVYFLLSISTATYVPELFETPYRLRGVGICATAGRLATIFSPYLIVIAFQTAGITGVVGALAGVLVVLMIVVLAFGIETHRMSLESLPGVDTSEPEPPNAVSSHESV